MKQIQTQTEFEGTQEDRSKHRQQIWLTKKETRCEKIM